MCEIKPEIKKILFAAGGTGGHVFPAIAVADALRDIRPDLEIAFVGSSQGNEEEWVKNAGYRFILLKTDFIKGASFLKKCKNIAAMPGTAKRAKCLLLEERPDLVIGAGGYVSGPLVAVAARMPIATAILEQNAIPGLTNRILAHFVDRIFTSFRDTAGFSGPKVAYLGNPVRTQALVSSHDSARHEPKRPNLLGASPADSPLHILILGGSQGAMSLNTKLPKAFQSLTEEEQAHLIVRHQTGKGKLEATQKAYAEAGLTSETTEFIHDMGAAYQWADLLICRAGATTLAEIKAAGKASILVPFPQAAHNHQEKNADATVLQDAAWKVLDNEVITRVPDVLRTCLTNPARLHAVAKAALADAHPQAAHDIAQYCLENDFSQK